MSGRFQRGRGSTKRALAGLLFILPALALYGWLVLGSFGQAVQFSFYDWNGFSPATFVGLKNYTEVFTSPARLQTVLHAFELIIFFTGLTVVLALAAAGLTRHLANGKVAESFRAILFLPQVIPLVAAAIGWSWMYADTGAVNQLLSAIGLESVTRGWLADPATALPAVGLIGTWSLLGITTMMLASGMTKIDPSLYEAARIDGASALQEFFAITIPGIRREITVCVTMTIIAALASFDIVYMSTQGGPARATLVPGVEIYQLAFGQQRLGAASALGVVLMALVLLVIIPIQRFATKE